MPPGSIPLGARGAVAAGPPCWISLEVLLVSVILALSVRTWVVQVYRIPTESMEPHLLAGDHVLVNKFIFAPTATDGELRWLPQRSPHRGDIAVFRFPPDPHREFIKRCIGEPREKLQITDKQLFLNEQEFDEAGYAVHTDDRVYSRSLFLDDGYRLRDNFGPMLIPEGYFFFLGDNRDHSFDSRFWGPVPRTYVRGRPWLVLWSGARKSENRSTSSSTPRLVR